MNVLMTSLKQLKLVSYDIGPSPNRVSSSHNQGQTTSHMQAALFTFTRSGITLLHGTSLVPRRINTSIYTSGYETIQLTYYPINKQLQNG